MKVLKLLLYINSKCSFVLDISQTHQFCNISKREQESEGKVLQAATFGICLHSLTKRNSEVLLPPANEAEHMTSKSLSRCLM